MPIRDGTGPAGLGPMTGRGMGNCVKSENLENTNPMLGQGYQGRGLGRGYGRGLGRGYGRGLGRGLGRGYGRYFASSPANSGTPEVTPENSTQEEKTVLLEQIKEIENELKLAKDRISEIEKTTLK